MTDGVRPLARFSVVDLTTVPSGPTCIRVLTHFDAHFLHVDRSGVAGRHRVFHDALSRENPRLIHPGTSGFGQETVLSDGVSREHPGGN